MKRRRPKKFLKFMWGQQQQQQKKKLLRSNSDDRNKDTNALCKRGSPLTQKEVKDICVLTSRAPPPPQRSM